MPEIDEELVGVPQHQPKNRDALLTADDPALSWPEDPAREGLADAVDDNEEDQA